MKTTKKIGILGGGQLGKMLAIAAADWDVDICFLDQSQDVPVGKFTSSFVQGDITNFTDVVSFSRDLDVLGIEIEHVNTDALRQCRKKGVSIYPDPDTLDLIKDKWLQSCFYQEHRFPIPSARPYASEFDLRSDISSGKLVFPFVQKSRSYGYDGQGVAIINSPDDLKNILSGATIVQDKIAIKSEISVIIARDAEGLSKYYEPVEMVFNPTSNMLDLLVCPARISTTIRQEAIDLARNIANELQIVGLLAVELFLDNQGKLWVNEVAPRPHNSGHHTIENNKTNQFQQLIRILSGLPLGDTSFHSPAAMINIVGPPNHTGEANFYGMEEILSHKNAFVHLYGKKITKPYRKMGHLTVLDPDVDRAIGKAQSLIKKIKIVTS